VYLPPPPPLLLLLLLLLCERCAEFSKVLFFRIDMKIWQRLFSVLLMQTILDSSQKWT
jgi:hypothetical protein